MIDVIVRAPQWEDRAHTMIRCMVDWKGYFPQLSAGEHPFVAAQDDVHGHGREIFDRILQGEFGRIAEWGV